MCRRAVVVDAGRVDQQGSRVTDDAQWPDDDGSGGHVV